MFFKKSAVCAEAVRSQETRWTKGRDRTCGDWTPESEPGFSKAALSALVRKPGLCDALQNVAERNKASRGPVFAPGRRCRNFARKNGLSG